MPYCQLLSSKLIFYKSSANFVPKQNRTYRGFIFLPGSVKVSFWGIEMGVTVSPSIYCENATFLFSLQKSSIKVSQTGMKYHHRGEIRFFFSPDTSFRRQNACDGYLPCWRGACRIPSANSPSTTTLRSSSGNRRSLLP